MGPTLAWEARPLGSDRMPRARALAVLGAPVAGVLKMHCSVLCAARQAPPAQRRYILHCVLDLHVKLFNFRLSWSLALALQRLEFARPERSRIVLCPLCSAVSLCAARQKPWAMSL